jgi:hypothetical protein
VDKSKTVFWRLVPALFLLAGFCFSSCAGSPSASSGGRKPAANIGKLIRTDPEEKPGWVTKVPQSANEIYFVGISDPAPALSEAREGAQRNATNQVSRFYGQFIQENMSIHSRYAEDTGVVLSDLTQIDSEVESFAQAVVTQIKTDQYFTQVYEKNGSESYIVYALCQIPREKAEADIRNFAEDVSGRYGNLLAKSDSLMTTLASYGHVLKTLEQNPLHRAVAYYNNRGGRVSLYDFIITEMNAMANSVTFSPVSSSIKQNDESLDMTVRVGSSYAQYIGPLDVAVQINGVNGARGTHLVQPDNTVKLSIYTGPLQRGRYTVQFELPLKEQYAGIETNPQGSYLFAVTSVSAVIEFEGSPLSAAEKRSITENIQQGIQRYNAPIKLLTSGSAEYVIIVNYRAGSQQMQGTRFAVHSSSVSLSLARNGAVIRQSPVISGDNGMSAGEAFGNTLAALRANTAFFQGIAASLDQ